MENSENDMQQIPANIVQMITYEAFCYAKLSGKIKRAMAKFDERIQRIRQTRAVFPTDDSLFKLLYLAMKDITKKWTGRRQDWSRIYAQLVIYYGDRLPE